MISAEMKSKTKSAAMAMRILRQRRLGAEEV